MTHGNKDGFDSVTQYYAHVGSQWKVMLRNAVTPHIPTVVVAILLGVITGIINFF